MNGKELLAVQKRMNGITPQRLFVCLMIGLGLFGVFWLCYTRGACMRTVLPSPEWYFMDFFNHIFYVQEPSNVYDVNFNACFPPLAYMLYWLLAQMLPADTVVMDDPSALTSYALLLYVTYYVLLGILLYDSIRRLYTARGGRQNDSLWITLFASMSGVFIFSVIWTGNSALIACILLLRALELRDKEDRARKELALILIAVAAGLKIYPAVFGILYLKERRYKEAGRLIVYGILCFFVPFVFFGGIHGLFQMLQNQRELHSQVYYGWKSIQSTWNQIDNRFLHLNLQIVGRLLTAMYAIFAVVGVWLAQDVWKKLFLLCSIMVIVPFWAGSYTPFYLIIPLIYFLTEKRNHRADYVYAILFAGIFCFFVWNTPFITKITGDLSFAVRYASIYCMSLLLMIETFYCEIKNRLIHSRTVEL